MELDDSDSKFDLRCTRDEEWLPSSQHNEATQKVPGMHCLSVLFGMQLGSTTLETQIDMQS